MRKLHNKNKLVYGWGINDSKTPVSWWSITNGKRVRTYDDIYSVWKSILKRVFCPKFKEKYPTYKNTSICEEWKYLSNFKDWVLKVQPNKDWQNCEPDKDILLLNNKHYGEDTVIFVTKQLNYFILYKNDFKNLIGVIENKRGFGYIARVNNPFTKKRKQVGVFPTELEAHKAWQAKKHEYSCQLADMQDNPRVAEALRQRYSPDKDWTNK